MKMFFEMARLKSVNKSKALTCPLRCYNPKEAPNIISSNSDCFRAALNGPCFLYHKFHLFAVKISQVSFFKQHFADFDFKNLKLARLKMVPKNMTLTCRIRSYDPKETSSMISIHSDGFRSLNTPFRKTFSLRIRKILLKKL